MSLVNISDIVKCANLTYKVYQYGFTEVYNANAQYAEFGQSVNTLYLNLRQLERVFDKIGSIPPHPISKDSSFYNTEDLNAILDDPNATVKECDLFLQRRNCFEERGNFIRNVIWNGFVQDEVTLLHKKVMFHNIKITALMQPLELKLLADIQSLVTYYGEALLQEVRQLRELILASSQAITIQEEVRCDRIVIPPYLVRKFERLSIEAKPSAQSNDTFPMHDGINILLQYNDSEAKAANLSRFHGIEPASPTQQYVNMMRNIWIIQRIQSSAEYVNSRSRGNELLRFFVKDLRNRCLYVFSQHSDGPENPYVIRNKPDEADLDLLGEEAFQIWPVPVHSNGHSRVTEVEDMKIILRVPLRPLRSAGEKSLTLLRHTETMLEMIIKENAERHREINLRTVILSPIYADPANRTSAIDVGLYTFGIPTYDNLLSFQSHADLFNFQAAITGYRVVANMADIEVVIMTKKPTHYNARLQIWTFVAPGAPAQSTLPTLNDGSSSNASRSTIRALPNSSPPMATARRQSANDPSARPSSSGKFTFSSSQSSYSKSMFSAFSKRSTATAISEVTSLSDPDGSNTEAFIFETLREPLLVLFLRAKKQTPSKKSPEGMSDSGGEHTLLKIPIGPSKAALERWNCPCHKGSPTCTHSSVKGAKKTLEGEWCKGSMVNLAALGAHYNGQEGTEKEKVYHVQLNFGDDGRENKERFEGLVTAVQKLNTKKTYLTEDEKVGLRLKKPS
ncbi:hypothetical protein V492_02096 [Pseudogymnoascus sp. VKM F-4246]|nr:hypothetical protein V492_02096 [Pseudogymnoascus sp. VKM F-4246]